MPGLLYTVVGKRSDAVLGNHRRLSSPIIYFLPRPECVIIVIPIFPQHRVCIGQARGSRNLNCCGFAWPCAARETKYCAAAATEVSLRRFLRRRRFVWLATESSPLSRTSFHTDSINRHRNRAIPHLPPFVLNRMRGLQLTLPIVVVDCCWKEQPVVIEHALRC